MAVFVAGSAEPLSGSGESRWFGVEDEGNMVSEGQARRRSPREGEPMRRLPRLGVRCTGDRDRRERLAHYAEGQHRGMQQGVEYALTRALMAGQGRPQDGVAL